MLTTAPSSVFTNACPNFPANTLCYDVNGDGTNDLAVQLTPAPQCVKAQAIPVTTLNLADCYEKQGKTASAAKKRGSAGLCPSDCSEVPLAANRSVPVPAPVP